MQAPYANLFMLSSSYAVMHSAHMLNCSVVILLPNTHISPPIPNPSPIDLDCTLVAGSAVHRSGARLSAQPEALKGGLPPLPGPQLPIRHFLDPKVNLPDHLAGPSCLLAPTSHCQVPRCRLPSWPGAAARVLSFAAGHLLALAVLAPAAHLWISLMAPNR